MIPAPKYDATLSTVVGAWGLRQLVSTYAGPLIRIRDSVGGAQQDVGQDGSGNLASFTVTGVPFVVKVYDQSGNGADIGQTVAANQPQLYLTATPRGGPAMKFDGVDDFLVDPVSATNRPYMVANMQWALGIGNSTPNTAWASIAQIAHQTGANTSPYLRAGIGLFSSDQLALNYTANGAASVYVIQDAIRREHGWIALGLNYSGGGIYSGISGSRDSAQTGTAVTYPNATGLYIASDGNNDAGWGGYFVELVIFSNATPNVAALKTALYGVQSALFSPPGSAYRIKTLTNWAGSTEARLGEWEWATSAGGADITTPNTPVFSSEVDAANSQWSYNLVDNNTGTAFSTGTSVTTPKYFGVSFDSIVSIAELRLTAMFNYITATPKTFDIQYLDDNGVWQFLQNVDLTPFGNSASQVYTIAVNPIPSGPTITGISPTSGTTAGGTAVTLTGTNFTGTTDVKFDTTSATSIVVVSSTQITCVTPAHAAGAVNVTVYNPAGNVTDTSAYTYVAPTPTITSVAPASGNVAGGTAVTITGTLFTGATDVKFDTTSATSIVVVDANHITCVTPAHAAGAVNVEVFTPAGNVTAASAFTYVNTQVRVTQSPLLVLDHSPEGVRTTQTPLLVLYQAEEPNRVTQAPLLVLYAPKPVPLPAPVIPEVPVHESWTWQTAISAAHTSQEQRSLLRDVPRYKLQIAVLIFNDAERVAIYNMLMRYLKTVFTYPLFQYNVQLTQSASIGDTKLYCDTTKTDVRAGEFVALFDPYLEQIYYLACSTIDVNGVNLSAPMTMAANVNWQICPAFNFRITPSVGLNMKNIDGNLSLVMESVIPRVFQRPTAAPTLTTIDGILIVPDQPSANNAIPENFLLGIEWFDNGTSIPDFIDEWTNPHTNGTRSYIFDRRTQMDYWRAVCDTLRGKQNVALFPTFRNDLPLRDPVALGATQFTTNNINFFIWYLDNNFRYLAINTANGMKYLRIAGVEPHYDLNGNPDYLTVKLTASIGSLTGDNVISAISYMNLYRLDNDEVKLTHNPLDTQIDFVIKAVNE